MNYNEKKRILDELASQMSGKTKEDQAEGRITVRYDSATNSVHFLLSGTDYSMEDIGKAKHYLAQIGSVTHNPEEKLCCDVATACIDSIINQFIKDLNIPLVGTS